MAKWADGWDDQILADHLGVSKSSVATIRTDQCGLIRRVERKPDPSLEGLVELVDQVMRRVDALEQWAREQPETAGPLYEGVDTPPLLRRNGT